MYQEAAFIYHLQRVEPSVNAVRRFLAPLKRPYTLDHGQHFYNFKEMQWQRRYAPEDLYTTAVVESAEQIGEVTRGLIGQLALAGAREELFKILVALQQAIPDQWLIDESGREPDNA